MNNLPEIPGSTCASLVAQKIKHMYAMQETWVRSLGWEGKNILSNVFSYAAVAALILLLIIILPYLSTIPPRKQNDMAT